jgi:hypothetical protein
VRIEKATLIAGRPNEPDEPSFDRIEGHSPIVGLHAVEVPNDSLCRVQVDLGLRARGWLTTMLVSSWVILAVLLIVGLTSFSPAPEPPLSEAQVADIVLILVTTAVGVSALLAQGEFVAVAARMFSWMRAVAVAAVTLPVIQAGVLVSRAEKRTGPTPDGRDLGVEVVIVVVAVAALIAFLTTVAWLRSLRSEQRDPVRSPWDMTRLDEVLPVRERSASRRGAAGRVAGGMRALPYARLVGQYRFGSAAVGVRSAEAWRERYRWSDADQLSAVKAVERSERWLSGSARDCGAARPGCRNEPMPSGRAWMTAFPLLRTQRCSRRGA